MNLFKKDSITLNGTAPDKQKFFNKDIVHTYLPSICVIDEAYDVVIDYTVDDVISLKFKLKKERDSDIEYTFKFNIDDVKITEYEKQYYYIHNFKINEHVLSLHNLLLKKFVNITTFSDSLGNIFTPVDYNDFLKKIIEPRCLIADTFDLKQQN